MTTAPRADAIVLGTEVNGLGVLRSLGRLGIRCGAVRMPSRTDFAVHSRFLRLSREVARDADDDTLLAAVEDVAAQMAAAGPVVVIPTTDRFSEFLSRRASALAPRFVACSPSEALCDAFLDKWKTAELCTARGVRIPRTVNPMSMQALRQEAATLAFPVIVKPRYTYNAAFPGKNAVCGDAPALLAFFESRDLLGQCVVQEIVPSGDGDILVTATYSGSDGRVKAVYSGRKLRQYLPDYGATCFGVSERHPDLEAASRAFLDGLAYTGFAALEFARSRADGLPYFIELNTRTYYHNQLFADAGVDLTRIGYLDAAGAAAETGAGRQRDGVVWLDLRRDFQSMRITRRQGRTTLWRWLVTLPRARSFAVWNARDPLPFVFACLHRARDIAGRLVGRLRPGGHPQS